MVGPSISTEERRRFLFRLRVGTALFVGISMALVTVHSGAALRLAAGAFAAGTAVGAVLAWYVFPDWLAESRYDER